MPMRSLRSSNLTLVALLLLSLVPSAGGALRLVELASDVVLLPDNPRIDAAMTPALLHIVSSILFCVLGAFQFTLLSRSAALNRHQMFGKFLIACGLISATSGLWMTWSYTFPEFLQGALLLSIRTFVSLMMIFSLIWAVFAVLNLDIQRHRAWMIRAYALGQGAGTQVLVSVPWILQGDEPSGFTRDLLMTLAWLINMLVAERIVRVKRGA